MIQLPLPDLTADTATGPRRCGTGAAVGWHVDGRLVLACEGHRNATRDRIRDEGRMPSGFTMFPKGKCQFEEGT